MATTKRRDASARSKVLLQAYLSEPLRHRWSFPDDFLDSAVPGVSEGDIVILRLLSAREQAVSEDLSAHVRRGHFSA